MITHLGKASTQTKGPTGDVVTDSMDPKLNTNRAWTF
jgi:hypothetical protein